MAMSLPKIKLMKSSIKTPKLAMPNLKFVSRPNVGVSKAPKMGSKTKIKYK